jgi:DNA-binding XRE family transcriptional regulator
VEIYNTKMNTHNKSRKDKKEMKNEPQNVSLTELIIGTRKLLKESQEEFGKRFDLSHASVSDWESGKTEAGYKVIEFCLSFRGTQNWKVCQACGGTGIILLLGSKKIRKLNKNEHTQG